MLADRLAPGVAVDAVGAEVLEHERDVVAAGERLAPRVEAARRRPCARSARPRTGSACPSPASGSSRSGPSGGRRSRSTPLGMVTTRSGSTPASTYIRRTKSLGTHSSSTFSCSGAEPVGRDRAELPRLDDRQPAGAGGARGPAATGGAPRRPRCGPAAGRAASVASRLTRWTAPRQPARDAVVDDRQARGQAVVALPAHRDVLGRRAARNAGRARAAVVGLELVDVGGEGAGLARSPACSRSSSPGSSARRSSVRARSSTSRPSKVRPSTPSLIASGRPPRRGTSSGTRARQALGGGQRRAVPPHRRQRGRVDAAQQPADLARREARRTARRRRGGPGPRAARRTRSGTSPRILMLSRGLGALRRLDQQLRALVRDRRSPGRRRSGRSPTRPGLRGRGRPAPRSRASWGIAWRTVSTRSAG